MFFQNYDLLIKNVSAYFQKDFKRLKENYQIIWKKGSAKLLLYNQFNRENESILLIPSLINKYYILDLIKERSLVNFLSRHDFNVFILAWEDPLSQEFDFKLKDYINKRIKPALKHLSAFISKPINLLGYCLGGILALQSVIDNIFIKKLVLLATPYDFKKLNYLRDFDLELLFRDNKIIPASCVELLFYLINTSKFYKKFFDYNNLKSSEFEFNLFMSTQNWLHDGINVNLSIICELKLGIDSHSWANSKIAKITIPVLIIAPKFDQIVPYESSAILTKYLSNCQIIKTNSGHIGVLIGKKSYNEVYIPILNFLRE